MFALTDLETRLAVGRSVLRLAVEPCERFPGFSRSVFVTRSNEVVVEFGWFGGDEGTLRITAAFPSRAEALQQGLMAAGREPATVERDVVIDPEWLPEFPDDADFVASAASLREAITIRDPELFPSAGYAVIEDSYWVPQRDLSE